MKKVRVITAEEAALMVKDGDTVSTGGFVSCACPEALTKALENRFVETGHPCDLTLFFAAGQGHRDGTGGDHFGHEGMCKRVVGGHWDRAAKLGELALANKLEAYNLPQGVITHMYRDIAAHNIGTITHVGLNTFVDPRHGGGKLNECTKEDLVKLVNIEGEERLLYKPIPMDAKKIIARRAAMELPQDAIVNLGTGAPEKIANVCAEEGISNKMTLTVEAGSIAGVPYGGTQFGGAANSMAILDHNVQFDFYQGGGLDVAFLGLAETAPNGDLNVSKFGTRLAGAGGFIDITQNAKKVVYCGTFTAKGLKTECRDGKLVITQEGAKKKFVKQVEQITFSGDYANKVHQPVLYITERAVFELRPEGVTLIEIAPGIDLQTQVLDQMEFMPKIADDLKLMDERIFHEGLMGLAND